MNDEETVGQRIRRCRHSRGLSLDQTAGLAGISKPYLSRIERDQRSIDSRVLLLRIATALQASVSDLTGQPDVPRDRQHADAQRAVAALRLALLAPDGPLPPLPAVASAVEGLPAVLTHCDLVEQARLLPDLLR
jgi:transcriptional regulator with XRE-family HTH domain